VKLMDAEILAAECGMVQAGHFLLTSGLHSPVYWEKFRILEDPASTVALCAMIAENFRDAGVDVVAGPTTGGIILAHEVARQLGVRAIYAEKTGETRAFRRGMKLAPGERVLLVDDVLTTGKSVREVLAALAGSSSELVGVGVLVDRSVAPADYGAPLFSCISARPVTYDPADCPLCRDGVPLVKPGSS
jgi:orotate phosphoribosyltransferase